tara:strand:+ start:896 stop:1117 length:222 start_codon:yes stop_codon:yes gene_type:complete
LDKDMNEQCKQAILGYVSEETQRNAALFGEHKEYVQLVITLLRDEYKAQFDSGATDFVVPELINGTLISMRPW